MRLRSLFHRPSPAFVIASLALFISLGGAGYAATRISNNSVGTNQLRNNAVSYKKIQPGAVGDIRADTKQLQERVSRTCSANSAMSAIGQSGLPTCVSTLPGETGPTTHTVALPPPAPAADRAAAGEPPLFHTLSVGRGPSAERVVPPTPVTKG